MSRYSKEHYEDVAEVLSAYTRDGPSNTEYYGARQAQQITEDFADLFAADNPPYCINCGAPAITDEVCVSAGGRPYDEHLFEGGFNSGRFLTACGLTTETEVRHGL